MMLAAEKSHRRTDSIGGGGGGGGEGGGGIPLNVVGAGVVGAALARCGKLGSGPHLAFTGRCVEEVPG